ncbi:Dabb family protein [Rhodococcus sp. SGAir0479]|uniref:Dabb family protein n=1 Tax=Rhodococcus sp. SGAir0479 TaxID=2567884 RepID=UPI0010CD0BC2|nr:Dabb family protein [Rhodococcus sp. SGAir0479]QCQ90020.1 Dabb family protein [Rhodococcus sp. SGAir0479]
MFEVIRLIHFTATADRQSTAAVLTGLRAAVVPHATAASIAPTLPGGINAGHAIFRVRFPSESDWRAAEHAVDAALWTPTVERVDGVTFPGAVRVARSAAPPRVYRTLLVAVDPAAEPDDVRQFEIETAAMPHYIRSIGASQLARVSSASGAALWTHVWEQEYSDLGGLTGPYMSHPYHWAHVDRWFDGERGQKIVTALCHGFATIEESILTAG